MNDFEETKVANCKVWLSTDCRAMKCSVDVLDLVTSELRRREAPFVIKPLDQWSVLIRLEKAWENDE